MVRRGRTLYFGEGPSGLVVWTVAAVEVASGRLLRWRVTLGQSEEIHPPILWALAANSRLVFLGGGFASVNGHPARRLAAVDARTGQLVWTADVDGRVTGVALARGRVFLAGFFGEVNGRRRARAAALDVATGRLLDWHPTRVCRIYYGLLASDRAVYLNSPDCGLTAASVDNGRTLWRSPGAALAIAGNRLLVAGSGRVEARTAATGRVLSWAIESGGGETSAAITGSDVAIAGAFHPEGGVARLGLGALDAAMGRPTSWTADLQAGGSVGLSARGLAAAGNTLYVAGEFTRIADHRRAGLAALDLATGRVRAFSPPATVDCVDTGDCAIAATTSALYVSSTTMNVRGKPRTLAAFDPSTGRPLAWNPVIEPEPFLDSPVLAVSGSTVYLGGHFKTVGGLDRAGLAAVDAITGTPTAWQPRPDGGVTALAVADGTLYVGGWFSHIAGAERKGLAEFDLTTGELLPWDPGAGSDIQSVGSLVPSGSTVYIGGNFEQVGGASHHGIAAIDANTGAPRAWSPNVDGVLAIAVTPTRVYVGYSGHGGGGLATFTPP